MCSCLGCTTMRLGSLEKKDPNGTEPPENLRNLCAVRDSLEGIPHMPVRHMRENTQVAVEMAKVS